jgi:hypothetical protein
MRVLLAVLFSAMVLPASPVSGDEWTTDYEASSYKRTPNYEQTVEYCKRMAAASPWVTYTTFGTSPQGRDLSLLIVDREGHTTPAEVRESGNVVFLIQAGIHAGEIDGKDAGLMLVRDIAARRTLDKLIDNVTILFMPIFNVDGHERSGPYNRANQNGPEEMGWRTTAGNLNLNRDYVKADAPEMQAWLRLYTDWLPDFMADCHVTDGADYQYVVTYAMENLGSMDPDLTDWATHSFLPPFRKHMESAGFPVIRYNWYRERHNPRSGIRGWVSPLMLSTGYAAMQNRPSILIETHMFKPYKQRVEGTYEVLRSTLEILNEQHKTLSKLVAAADERAASAGFRREPFALSYQMTGDSVMIDFLGYEYEVVDSEITGGKWHKFSKTPATFQIPFFNSVEPDVTVALPEAYIVPAEWPDVIRRLSLHGVRMSRLGKTSTLPIRTYKMSDPEWRGAPFEGRFVVSSDNEEFTEARTFAPGSAVIDMNQRAARVIAHILEPDSRDSFVHWGFFNTVFEQKEYIESYVLEHYIHQMLEQDEALRQEYEQKKESDPEWADSPQQIRRWFYRRTPFWDTRIGVYPVGRINNRDFLDHLPLE